MLQKLTVQRVALIVLFMLLFVIALRPPLDTDTWWHLRAGHYTIEQRAPLTFDPFSHTRAGEPWINHSWGAQLVMVLFHSLAGDAGLALYTALLATAGMGFVYLASAGSVYLRTFALVLGAATAAVFWSARPQMCSFLLSTVVLYLLYRHKRLGDRRALWVIPPVMLLWVNLHGGFAIGFILLFGAIAGEVLAVVLRRGGAGEDEAEDEDEEDEVVGWGGVRALGLVAALSLAAICINPYGPVMLTYPFRTVGIGVLQDFIQEWASPDFHSRQTWPFVVLLMGVLAAAGVSRRRLDYTDLLLVAGTGFMALLAARNIATFAVVATPVLTRHVDAWLEERGWIIRTRARVPRSMAYLNLALVGLVGFVTAMIGIGPLLPDEIAEAQAETLPVAAAAWLQGADLRGKMFNSYNWGGYLMYAAPDYPVFVDGRTDLYDDALLTEFLRAWRGLPGWETVLAGHDIGFVVVEAQSGLANVLRQDAAWSAAYQDDLAIVFIHEEQEG